MNDMSVESKNVSRSVRSGRICTSVSDFVSGANIIEFNKRNSVCYLLHVVSPPETHEDGRITCCGFAKVISLPEEHLQSFGAARSAVEGLYLELENAYSALSMQMADIEIEPGHPDVEYTRLDQDGWTVWRRYEENDNEDV